jgi:hypothetical protein
MNKTMPLYESPVKDRNEDKYGTISEPQCICCMKPIKNIQNAYTVHMNTDWLAVHPSISEEMCAAETGADSQGCFDIGPECAKHMKGFVIKN